MNIPDLSAEVHIVSSIDAPPQQCFLPWAHETLWLETNHRPTKQEEDIRIRIHRTFISSSLRCSPKKLFQCQNLTTGCVRATLHSTNSSLNTELHYELMFNTVYNTFNSFHVQRQTDNAIPQRKILIGIEATVSIIYCTVQMRH